MEIKLAKLKLKNPVVLASGTFDRTICQYIDVSKLGAITTKTITLEPRQGNPLPRIIKTKYGFLNSDGWKNPGIKKYLAEELPFWQKSQPEIIQSIGGFCDEDYVEMAKIFEKENIKAIELNVSCVNVHKGLSYLTDTRSLVKLIKKVRKVFSKNLIVKLGANVGDIVEISRICLNSGADILSLINTIPALEIDNKTKKAKLPFKIGGYSGSAIKPIALRCVWQVYKELHCPIIGGGGISEFEDALDFVMCGATAVSIGSANFSDRKISVKIVRDFENYFKKHKIKKINQIRGLI